MVIRAIRPGSLGETWMLTGWQLTRQTEDQKETRERMRVECEGLNNVITRKERLLQGENRNSYHSCPLLIRTHASVNYSLYV